MQVGATSLLAVDSGGLNQLDGPDSPQDYEFQGVADLVGPAEAKPAPNSDFFDNKKYFAYRYETTDTNERFFITQNDDYWTEIGMTLPKTQIDEVQVEDYRSFFNHTFSRPGAPDGKNWSYVASEVTKVDSEIELASSTRLIGKQRGNYPPGSQAVPGVAFRLTSTPTGGEAFGGYFADGNGDGIPDVGFGFGSDATSDFAFLAKNGTLKKIRQSNWNGESVSSRPFVSHYPRIGRLPHLFYGGGAINYRILAHETVNGTPTPVLKTVHIETPETAAEYGAPFNEGPPFNQPNLPPAFTTNGLTGGSLRANAAHYESGEDESEQRVNGQHYNTGSSAIGTSSWVPLLSYQKRSGWEMVNVKPLVLLASAVSSDIKFEIRVGGTLTGASWSLPPHTASDETAIEVDTAATAVSGGQRRGIGYAVAGSGQLSLELSRLAIDFNLPVGEAVTIAAQAVGNSGGSNGGVAWEEFF